MKPLIPTLLAFIACLAAPFLSAQEAAPAEEKPYSVVILGGGTGALTSALYLVQAGYKPLVIEGANPGGLITQSHSVQNWPGEMEISGLELAEKLRKQAESNGAVFQSEEVVAVDFSKRPFTITTRSIDHPEQQRQVKAEACIIAMGTQSNYLGVPGETGPDGYWGRGVSNCAICDGSLYRDGVVGVAGGGDAAILEGLYLSNLAREVYVFVRKDSFKQVVEEKRLQTLLSRPNVKIFYDTAVQAIKGSGDKVTQVTLKTKKKQPFDFPVDALFLAIGARPNTNLFQHALKLDENGYIVLSKDQETSVEGVYAVGDIVDPIYKQAISAAGDGAKAAMQAQKYLSDRTVAQTQQQQQLPPKKVESEPISKTGVIEITSKEQFDRELKSDIPVLVDFYATWCGPCKRISPLIEASAGRLSGKVKFLKVNVDKLNPVSKSYQVTSMPTVILFDPTGAIIERKVGANPITDLLKRLETQNK